MKTLTVCVHSASGARASVRPARGLAEWRLPARRLPCMKAPPPIRTGSVRTFSNKKRSRYGKVDDAILPAVHDDDVVENTEPPCNNTPDKRNVDRVRRLAIFFIAVACSIMLVAVLFPDDWFVLSSVQNTLQFQMADPSSRKSALPPMSPPFTSPSAPSAPSSPPNISPLPPFQLPLSPWPWSPPLLPPASPPTPSSPPTPQQGYLDAVYGPGVSVVDVESLQLVYGPNYLPSGSAQTYVQSLFSDNAPCFALGGEGDVACSRIQSGDQTRKTTWPPWASNEGVLLYNPLYRGGRPRYQAHSWAEVTRWPAACRRDSWQCEGLTVMSQNYWRQGDSWADTPRAYGCWFFLAPGSGIFVNTGRTVFFENRDDASQFFGVASDKAQRDGNAAADDTGWCSEAVRRGIDSIQVNVHSYLKPDSGLDRGLVELVVCNERCATEELCGACPPLELRTGAAAGTPCSECDERGGMLNCGRLVPSTCDGSDPRPLTPSTKSIER